MSVVNGRIVTCDICGEQVFSKCTGDGEADGGFTRWNNFETAEEWTSLYWGKHRYKDICPECADAVEKAIDEAVLSRTNTGEEMRDG